MSTAAQESIALAASDPVASGSPAEATATLLVEPTVALPVLDSPVQISPPASQWRIAALVDRVRPRLGRPVDAMQVAAALEADGITDRSALVDHECPDVFTLADEVFRRLGPAAPVPDQPPPAGADRRRFLHDVSRGLVYLLSSALFPAVLAVVGRQWLVLGLVVAGGLGWVWSAGAAWLAYRLLGRGLLNSAGRVLRWSALASLPVGAAVGGVLATSVGGGGRLVGLIVALLAYQMASTVALFYRREAWLVAIMGPGVVAGLCYLVFDQPSAPAAATIGLVGIAAAFALAIWQTTDTHRPSAAGPLPAPAPVEPALRRSVRPESVQLTGVLLYAALLAAVLLVEDARHLGGPLDLALAAAPLIVGMGVVEWRTRLFYEQARQLLHQVYDPRHFVAGVWVCLATGLGTVMSAVGALAVVLLLALRQGAALSPAGVVLVGGHVAVAGAYFLAFILAGQAQYGWLCLALATVLVVHVGLMLFAGGLNQPRDAVSFLGSALLLQLLLMIILARTLGQAWRYR